MTSRQRLLTVVQGGTPDQTPIIGVDALLIPLDRVLTTLKSNPDQLTLATVDSPFALARKQNLDIFTELQSDPIKGNETLDKLCMAVQIQMNDALAAGADGICYVIDGAYPTSATPMQYGGFFLERDRELLESITQATFNLLLIAGSQEPYIDFVSDLPAHAFAWETTSGWTPDQVKVLRSGILAADHPDADIQFPASTIQTALQSPEATAKP
jgi:uroporphyrinogen-III decarboxylase